jgi:hypothetical protein
MDLLYFTSGRVWIGYDFEVLTYDSLVTAGFEPRANDGVDDKDYNTWLKSGCGKPRNAREQRRLRFYDLSVDIGDAEIALECKRNNFTVYPSYIEESWIPRFRDFDADVKIFVVNEFRMSKATYHDLVSKGYYVLNIEMLVDWLVRIRELHKARVRSKYQTKIATREANKHGNSVIHNDTTTNDNDLVYTRDKNTPSERQTDSQLVNVSLLPAFWSPISEIYVFGQIDPFYII